MVPSPIYINGLTWPSVENYYQAMKTTDPEQHRRFAKLTPSQSKLEGRKLKLRSNWEDLKYSFMKEAVRTKFLVPFWRDQLLASGDDMIIEWNNWGDKIWGVTINDNEGQNLLGKCLMEIREELKPKP